MKEFYKKNKNLKNNKGFIIAEVLVSIAVFSFIIVSVNKISVATKKISKENERQSIVHSCAQEWMEVVNVLRGEKRINVCDSDDNCSKDFKIIYDNDNGWELKELNGDIDYCGDSTFERKLTIENLAWDDNWQIDPSGKFDRNTKKITVTVKDGSKEISRDFSISTIMTPWEIAY